MNAAVRVLFFARYAELVGRDITTVTVPLPATVADVVARVRRELEGAAGIPERPLTALNATHVQPHEAVADGDEIALLPPVSGG